MLKLALDKLKFYEIDPWSAAWEAKRLQFQFKCKGIIDPNILWNILNKFVNYHVAYNQMESDYICSCY